MMRQRGFGAIAAIVVLVILAVLSASLVSIGTTQQTTAAQDVMSARAWQAARAGNEWGLYQALKGSWKEGAASDLCPAAGALGLGAAATQTLDMTADSGFYVTVTGECWRYNEGESVPGTPKTVLIYRVKAVACPLATCPASGADLTAVSGAGYVERTRVVLATN